MKYVIWNKTQDKFWSETQREWSNRYYATKYTFNELEKLMPSFLGSKDVLFAVLAINI